MHPSIAALQQNKQELGLLAHDLQNASTTFALKAAVEKMFNTLAHVVYIMVDQAQGTTPAPAEPVRAAVQPAPAPLPVQQQVAQPAYPAGYHVTPNYQNHLVSPPTITQPVALVSPGMVTPEIGPSDKLNVVITPTGTTVIPPLGGQPVYMPPQAHVDASGIMEPAVPPPAPPGVMNVVLPRGGVMPAEVAQAVTPDAIIPPK